MKEILIPLNFTTTPTVYDTKQSFSTSDEASGVLTFTTTADVAGTVASLTIRNASKNANRQTVRIERQDVNSSPFSYALKNPLPFGQYEGTVLLKKNLTVIASATFLFGVNSRLSAEVLPDLVKAYSLDELVENVETEVSNLKDAFNLTVSETVKGVNKTESKLQASENVRYLNEATRKNNNSLWKAQAEAFALAEKNRVIEFNDLVDSAVIEQTVVQEVAEKYQEIEALNAKEIVSFRQQLAEVANKLEFVTPINFGGIGDKIADDTQAVLDAIAYCETNNVPLCLNKFYKVTQPISFTKKIIVFGIGYQYGGLIYAGPSTTKFISFDIGSDFSAIRNITIDGGVGKLVDLNVAINVPYIDVTDCLIQNNLITAIQFSKTYCDNIMRNRIYGGDYAMITKNDEIWDQAGVNSISITENIILFCEKFAFFVGGGDSWDIRRNTIEHCKLGALYFSCGSSVNFSNNYIELTGTHPQAYVQALDTFYIRSIITLNNDKEHNNLFANTQTNGVVIDNNFININPLVGAVPDGYEDIATLVLAVSVNNISVTNNVHTAVGAFYELVFGSRLANTLFDVCYLSHNKNFKAPKMIGSLYTDLTVNPIIRKSESVEYNYQTLDYSDAILVNPEAYTQPTVTTEKYFKSNVYTVDEANKYILLRLQESAYKDIIGKTAYVGFFGYVPTGTKFSFHVPNVVPGVTVITQEFDEWTFIGLTINFPSTVTGNFDFMAKIDVLPTGETVKIAKPILCEVGVDLNKLKVQ